MIVTFLITVGCDRATSSINASNKKTLNRSMTGIKRALPKAKRLEFEVSYWSLKKWSKDDSAFQDLVHRKNATELAELAKQQFDIRKAEGDPELAKYESWDSMIEILNSERLSYGRD